MTNTQQTVTYLLFFITSIVVIILILSPLALAISYKLDICELWNTIEEFEETSSFRKLLIEHDWVDDDVTIDQLDYILVLTRQCSSEFFPNVPTSLVMSVISIESSFKPDLVGFNDDIGLMQIIEKYHRDRIQKYIYDENIDLYDPRLNIMVGMDYLSELLDKFDGDIYTTLMAYNMGPDRARMYRNNGWSSGYADVVMDRMNDISIFFERRNVSCS